MSFVRVITPLLSAILSMLPASRPNFPAIVVAREITVPSRWARCSW
jgi:hypothetical protein